MPSIYLSPKRYAALRVAAAESGYNIGRGAHSQTGEFIQALLDRESIAEYNALVAGLVGIGLFISSDNLDNDDTWHYRWQGGAPVRGFATPAAALIAAIQELAR